MAEAVAAFSLASNVLQFVDFGLKVAARFRDFYHSSRYGEVVPDVSLHTKLLQAILNDLTTQDDGDKDGVMSPFNTLANQCNSIATELMRILDSLQKAKNSSTESRVSALKLAFKLVWKEDDIKRLELRLDHLRSQLVLQLVSESRVQIRSPPEHQEFLLRRIEEKVDTLCGALQDHTRERDSFGSSIVELVVSKLESQDRTKQKISLTKEILESILSHHSSDDTNLLSLPLLSARQLSNLTNHILARLHFSNAGDRVQGIATAHAETFQWIFNNGDELAPKGSRLTDWFASDERLYWVTGKAGSGKSTLMKYICQPEDPVIQRSTKSWHAPTRCDQYLRAWAPHANQIIKATYFLWNSGAELQMSQNGLLRSLLYQVFSQAPSLIPLAMPDTWEALCLFRDDDALTSWTDQDLVRILKAASANMDEDMRLCLFIDGLDEFGGDLHVLIQMLKDLGQNVRVKVCLSSRPWEVFGTAFDKRPSLRMEDLTQHDIKAYTLAELRSNPEFSLLQKREPQYADNLVDSIVKKASGVFLWVKLVVVSLLAGISYGDRITDLQRRLDALPPELEKLYDKMLDSLDSFYLEHAAQYFVLKDMCLEQMSTILLSFIDDETLESALERRVQELTNEELVLRHDTIRRRINSRTKGLLEVTKVNSEDLYEIPSKIDYLHRTVSDYVRQPAIKARLESAMRNSFDGHMQICIGMLAFLKTRKPSDLLDKSSFTGISLNDCSVDIQSDTKTSSSQFWMQLTQIMHSASRVSTNNYKNNIRLLDALDATGMQLLRKVISQFPPGAFLWTKSQHYEPQLWLELHPACRDLSSPHFLNFAIRYDLVHYVRHRAVGPCVVQIPVGLQPATFIPLITHLVEINDSGRQWSFSGPSIRMAQCLIDQEARFQYRTHAEAAAFDPAIKLAAILEEYAIEVLSKEDTLLLLQITRLLVAHYEQIWSPPRYIDADTAAGQRYHNAILSCGKGLALSQWIRKASHKTFLASMSHYLSSTSQRIHSDRLILLKAVESMMESLFLRHGDCRMSYGVQRIPYYHSSTRIIDPDHDDMLSVQRDD